MCLGSGRPFYSLDNGRRVRPTVKRCIFTGAVEKTKQLINTGVEKEETSRERHAEVFFQFEILRLCVFNI